MFNLSGNKVMAVFFVGLSNAKNSQIITFCAAAGENNFLWVALNKISNELSCLVDCFTGLLSKSMEARRIAIFFVEIGQYSVKNADIKRGGCGMIKVNHWANFTM